MQLPLMVLSRGEFMGGNKKRDSSAAQALELSGALFEEPQGFAGGRIKLGIAVRAAELDPAAS